MTAAGSWAIITGLMLGVGLWTIVGAVPRFSRPSLGIRVAPFVLDVSEAARQLLDRRPASPLPVFGLILSPIGDALVPVLSAVFGGDEQSAKRLRQSGSTLDVRDFRGRQLAWSAGGAAIGVVVSITVSRYQELPAALVVAIVLVATVIAIVAREYELQRAARSRIVRMEAELPALLEFLTLSLSAGEGIVDAFRRIVKVSRGELSEELGTVIADVSLGIPFVESLEALGSTLEIPAFTRCVEQIVGALDRGTPIVEVLRAQAQDVREESKRHLLEVAGRKEVAMLVPLVFLILPTTVLFAIFPGIFVLQMGL